MNINIEDCTCNNKCIREDIVECNIIHTDAITMRNIFSSIDTDVNSFAVEIKGEKARVLTDDYGQGSLLYNIEIFVIECIKSEASAYTFKSNEQGKKISVVNRKLLTKNLTLMPGIIEEYNRQKEYVVPVAYSVYIDIVFDVLKEHKYSPDMFKHANEKLGDKISAEVFNELCYEIFKRGNSSETKAKLRDRIRQSKRQREKAIKYIQALFKRRKRYLVIRLDLYYLRKYEDLETSIPVVSLERIKRDFQNLIRNSHHNKIFNDMRGYIWRMEEGRKKGLHIHMILFFSDRNTQSDVAVGNSIGEYWSNVITKGDGWFNNCNLKKKDYEKLGILGIGKVSRDDSKLYKNLLTFVIDYITKRDQYLKVKLSGHSRVFGTGAMPGVNEIEVIE